MTTDTVHRPYTDRTDPLYTLPYRPVVHPAVHLRGSNGPDQSVQFWPLGTDLAVIAA